MKKVIVFLFIIISFYAFTQDNTSDTLEFWAKNKVPCYIWNDTLKRMDNREIQLYIKNNFEKRIKLKKEKMLIIELYYNDYLYRNSIEISPEQRIKLLEIIKKYKEWNDKATKESVELDKEIDFITYDLAWTYSSKDDWYHANNRKLKLKFFSQNKKQHQLIFSFSVESSSENQYNTHRPESIYINFEQVLLLEKYLSDDYIQTQIEIANKEKAKSDSFK